MPPNFAGPYWPGGLTEQFRDPGAVLSSWAGTNDAHILAPADGAFLTPRARQAPEEETACCIFLAPSPAVGFGYAITWALFLSRPGCVLLSPGLWNLPSDLLSSWPQSLLGCMPRAGNYTGVRTLHFDLVFQGQAV